MLLNQHRFLEKVSVAEAQIKVNELRKMLPNECFITSAVGYTYSDQAIRDTLTALKTRAEFACKNSSAESSPKIKYAEINDAIASEPRKSNAGVTKLSEHGSTQVNTLFEPRNVFLHTQNVNGTKLFNTTSAHLGGGDSKSIQWRIKQLKDLVSNHLAKPGETSKYEFADIRVANTDYAELDTRGKVITFFTKKSESLINELANTVLKKSHQANTSHASILATVLLKSNSKSDMRILHNAERITPVLTAMFLQTQRYCPNIGCKSGTTSPASPKRSPSSSGPAKDK